MKSKDYEKWKTIREKGKLRYLLFNGVLGFGAIIAIIFMGVGYSPHDERLITTKVLAILAVWVISGLILGIGIWSVNERLFKHHSRAGNDALQNDETDSLTSELSPTQSDHDWS